MRRMRGLVSLASALVLAGLLSTLLGGPAGAAPSAPLNDPPVVDDFNRPDEQPLRDGGRWSNLTGGYELKVVSNQLACSVSSTCTYWRNDVRYGLDQEVMVTVAAKPGHNNWLRLFVRLQQPTIFEGYALRYQDNTNGPDQVTLERVTAGAPATLASTTDELFPGDRLRLRVVGPTLEAWRTNGGAWTLIASASDSTYLGVGYTGVDLRYPNARLDDFAAASLREPVPDSVAPADNFNRPDEQPLSDSGRWSNLGGGYQLKVVSNQLACSVPSTCTYWRNDVRYGPDQEAWATLDTKPGHGNWFRLYARLQLPTTTEGYALRYHNNPGTDQIFLERHQGGQVTTLATFNQEIMMGDKLKIRAVGTMIEAWRRDNNTGSWSILGPPASDATFVGSGYVAVSVRYPYARLDDFGAATLRAPVPDTSLPIDTFNRADEQPVSDSGKWSQLGGYQLKVVSNQLACSASSTCQSWRSDVQYGADQEAWATFAVKPSDWVRLYVRLQMP